MARREVDFAYKVGSMRDEGGRGDIIKRKAIRCNEECKSLREIGMGMKEMTDRD